MPMVVLSWKGRGKKSQVSETESESNGTDICLFLYPVRSVGIHFLKNNSQKQHDIRQCLPNASTWWICYETNETLALEPLLAQTPVLCSRSGRGCHIATSSNFYLSIFDEMTKGISGKGHFYLQDPRNSCTSFLILSKHHPSYLILYFS